MAPTDSAFHKRVLAAADERGHGDLEAFAEEWQRILPRIEEEVSVGARALVTTGAPGLVRTLLPEGRWDPDQRAIIVEKDWDGSCDIAERGGMVFVPTVYGWPCGSSRSGTCAPRSCRTSMRSGTRR